MTVTTLLQGFSSQAAFTSLLLLSSKGENPAQSKSDSIAGKKVFFSSLPPPPAPHSLLPPVSPFGRRGNRGRLYASRVFALFLFLKVRLLCRQITGDQDQVPQSEAALPRRGLDRQASGRSWGNPAASSWPGGGGDEEARAPNVGLQICFGENIHPLSFIRSLLLRRAGKR